MVPSAQAEHQWTTQRDLVLAAHEGTREGTEATFVLSVQCLTRQEGIERLTLMYRCPRTSNPRPSPLAGSQASHSIGHLLAEDLLERGSEA